MPSYIADEKKPSLGGQNVASTTEEGSFTNVNLEVNLGQTIARAKRMSKNGLDILARKMKSPRHGFGMMHYSSLKPAEVQKAFSSLSDEFKQTHSLDMPRKAYDSTDTGRSQKNVVVGVYWVISEVE